MNIKRLLAVLLAAVMLIALLPATNAAAAENEVVLRFLVASDIHLTDNPNDKQAQMLQGMFASAYAYADTQSYTAVDAVVLVGDIVCLGEPSEYASLSSALAAANLREETEVLTLMGNHEWWRYTNNAMTDLGATSYLNALAGIDAITEKGVNWSKSIGGFRFIGMSPLSDDTYGEENSAWMAEELAAAHAADGEKPLFVFHHHPIAGTVLGSSAAMPESETLDAIYGQYNQLILFTGHSHIPINSPTTINQTTYTQYNTGTMGTLGSAANPTYNGALPGRDNVGQYTIVEVSADNTVRLIPYDQFTDSRFASLNGDGTFIEYTVDVNHPENWLYKADTRPDNGGDPAFAAEATATATDAAHDSFLLTFPQASDNTGVYYYDITCDGGDLPLAYRIYSEYYFQPMPDTLQYTVTGLTPETAYTVSVTPVDFFGNSGEPITCTVTTAVAPDVEEEIVLDPSAYSQNLTPNGNAESQDTTDWALFKNAAFTQEQVHGGNYALKLTNSDTQAQVQVNIRGIVGGGTYRMAAWVYTEAAAGPTVQRSLIAAVESPWKTLDAAYATVPTTAGEWTKYEFTYVAPAGADLFQLSFYTADANTHFYLDDLEVYRVCTHPYTTYVEATAASDAYWTCRTCGKAFADEDCTVEIAPPVDDGKTYIPIDPSVETDLLHSLGYNTGDSRTYFVFQTAETLPVANWGGYSGSATITVDSTAVTVKAAGMNDPHQLQLYVTDTAADLTAATRITVPAGTAFTKDETVVRFVKEFTLVKVNGVWKKAVSVPDHSEIGPNLPAGHTNLLSFGRMDSLSGFSITGDGQVKGGTLQMNLSGTDDMAQFTVPLEAGKTYRFSAYMYVTLGYNVSVNGEENGATGTYKTGIYSEGLKADTDGWVEMTYEFTAAATGSFTFHFVRNYWGGNATVFVDDLCLYDVNDATRLTAYNVTLSSDLKVGVQVTPAFGTSLDDLILTYTLDGETQTAESADGLFYCHLPAKAMTAPLSLTLADRDGQTLDAATMTLRDYALTLLEGEQPDAVKTAARAMLGYGAAAQVYFDYRTDSLADAGYAFTREELDAADAGETAGVTAEDPSAAFCGATLLLHSRIGIRLYFTENVGGELLYHEQKGLYYSELSGISANQLGTAQTVTVDGTAYTVSVLSLARQVMNNEAYDPAFCDLMKALTLYANAAAAL